MAGLSNSAVILVIAVLCQIAIAVPSVRIKRDDTVSVAEESFDLNPVGAAEVSQ